MSPFDRALQHTLGIEGDYSHDVADSGGATRFGVTEQVAREFGYKGEMSALPLEFAQGVYRQKYWDLLQLDLVAVLSERVAIELFDTAVNTGVSFAGKSFQRVLNAMNREQTDYTDIQVDGLVGPATIRSLRAFLQKRGTEGEQVIFSALNCLQGSFYLDLAERRSKDEKFVYGWFKNRVVT
jgi:lysozyme family protein